MHTMAEVAPGIYTVDHRVAEGKNAIIVGRRGAWVIDVGSDAAEGQRMADCAEALNCEANRLIYTHGHGDHVLGSAAFQRAEVVAHALMPLETRRLLPHWATRASMSVDALAAQIAWPMITFRDELWIDLGDKHLWLLPTPGHSQDGISVYVAEQKLLVAGDAVVTGIVPAIGDGDSRVLEATLGRLCALEIEILIPGHGPVVYGRNAVLDWLHWLGDYLANLRSAVREALDGALDAQQTLERVASDAGYACYVGERLPKDRHRMPTRHGNTVQKIIDEEMADRRGGQHERL
jgi:glyoxylase-like metal-dependent hydrolase (beta-lactamase superfamily II)